MKSLHFLLAAGLAVSSLAAGANPLLHPRGLPGFIVLAEQRYDPAVQRFMAEQSLRALPLKNGQLFYVYPTNTSNAYIEQMQIRYLEVMLEKKAAESEPESE
ncbi:MAG: hypothetical protein NXH95_21455 [Pseudomonadaceae bacterium]|nr:hypothetical protein [Pseudomonadaceae bacterium]